MSAECANPLLLGWIKEWLDQARERNSKGVTVYKKAYESMKACPLTFEHPSQAQQLNGLGPKLCERLTEKLKAHCQENGLPMPQVPGQGASKRTSDTGVAEQPAKKPRKARPYVPPLRSGPYAILLGLATQDENASQGLTKAQLIEVAQPYCDSSFTAPPDPSKYFTAWSSMRTLIQKDLVYEHGRPVRKYALSEEGWEVAKRIQKTVTGPSNASAGSDSQTQLFPTPAAAGNVTPDLDTCGDAIIDRPPTTFQNALVDGPREPIFLPAGSFTVELVLDNREVRSSKDRDYIANELMKKGVTPQVRALELGDAMWVAKCRDPSYLARFGEEGDEVMLDWILERKRLDDLVQSIKDGRFKEQKFRLKRSGIKNVIYLVEEFAVAHAEATSGNGFKHQESTASAMASTQVVDGYFLKKTKQLDDSIRYLARMTRLLTKMYGAYDSSQDQSHASQRSTTTTPNSVALIPSRCLSSAKAYLPLLDELRAKDPSVTYGVTFSTFSALTSKSDVLSLRDVFLKMLMCIRGITGERALEIQRRWPTPRQLVEAYKTLEPSERETLLAKELHSVVRRKDFGKALSKKVAEIWGESG
ncbi:Uncharacterized protein PECH_005698 [Penicillium ucsense]|uniref:Crossover junction endonuclease MUS81 n=1 Tax=Penicillium ucsense TaxID=2839758 RepID=A0A8J8WM43_9EURO|nr:Uncharacterized protein PECM_004521 [Penicillium ucsense]KAF7736216.1 Uncharacterized protein PECH_005698 [Penicillium ucsense]